MTNAEIKAKAPRGFNASVARFNDEMIYLTLSDSSGNSARVYLEQDSPEDAWQRCLNKFKRKLAEVEEDED